MLLIVKSTINMDRNAKFHVTLRHEHALGCHDLYFHVVSRVHGN